MRNYNIVTQVRDKLNECMNQYVGVEFSETIIIEIQEKINAELSNIYMENDDESHHETTES